MKIGYVRVSTEEQNEARQLQMMKENGVEKIFVEKMSGTKGIEERKALKELLDFIRQSDIVYVESISRIGRLNFQVLSVINSITKEKGAQLISLKENFNSTTPQGQFVLSIFSSLAELEIQNLKQRQQEGVAIAKKAGKYKGRKPITLDANFKDVVSKWRKGEITATKAMKLVGLKPNTFYRRVKEFYL